MERSVPSCEENSARWHVGRIPLACPSGRAGTEVAPSATSQGCLLQHCWAARAARMERSLRQMLEQEGTQPPGFSSTLFSSVHPTCAPAPSASTTNRPSVPSHPALPSVPPRAARPCPGTHLPIGLFYQRSPSCGTEPARPADSSAPRSGKARVRVNGRWRSCCAPLLPSCRLLGAETATGLKVTPGRCSWGSLRRPGSVSGYIWKFMRSYHNTGNSK